MVIEADVRNKEYEKQFGICGTRLTTKNTRIRETGYIGEEIVKKAYPYLEFSLNPKFDFIINGITIDVKSVGCNTEPKSNYVGTVFDKPIADIIIFTRVLNNRNMGWVCGSIATDDFFKYCDYINANTVNNNFTYEHPRTTIEYSKLKDLTDILKEFK